MVDAGGMLVQVHVGELLSGKVGEVVHGVGGAIVDLVKSSDALKVVGEDVEAVLVLLGGVAALVLVLEDLKLGAGVGQLAGESASYQDGEDDCDQGRLLSLHS